MLRHFDGDVVDEEVYGEPVKYYREAAIFEVDGITYKTPNSWDGQIVRPMIELVVD